MPTNIEGVKQSTFTPRNDFRDQDLLTGLRIAGEPDPAKRNSLWSFATLREALADTLAGVAEFNPAATSYPPGAQVKYQERLWFTPATLQASTFPGNVIPPPGDELNNPWVEISADTSIALSETVGVARFKQMVQAAELVPGRLYQVVRASGAGNVFVEALTPFGLTPDAYHATPSNGLQRVVYNFFTDTVTPIPSGNQASATVPFGPLTATGSANESFPLPQAAQALRGVTVRESQPDAGAYPIISIFSDQYTLAADGLSFAMTAGNALQAGDKIEGMLFASAPTAAPGAPSDLAVDQNGTASFTPASGTTPADYEYQTS